MESTLCPGIQNNGFKGSSEKASIVSLSFVSKEMVRWFVCCFLCADVEEENYKNHTAFVRVMSILLWVLYRFYKSQISQVSEEFKQHVCSVIPTFYRTKLSWLGYNFPLPKIFVISKKKKELEHLLKICAKSLKEDRSWKTIISHECYVK